MKRLLTLFLLALPAAGSLPSPLFQPGEVIVGSANPACAVDPPPPTSTQIDVHGRDAARVRFLTDTVISSAMYGYFDGIYVARSGTSGTQSIDLLAPWGDLYPIITLPANRNLTAMTTIGGSELLAVIYDGATPELWRFQSGRTDRFTLPQFDYFIRSIDVAADRCTIFYTTTQSVERYDLCGHRPLAPFARLYATDVRVLPDGGVLVASGARLMRLDAVGNPILEIPLPPGLDGIGAMTLDANPSAAWIVTTSGCSTGTARLLEVNVATGSIMAGPQTVARSNGFTIAVQGEWHASVNKVPPRRRAVH